MIIKYKGIPYFTTRSEALKTAEEIKIAINKKCLWVKWDRLLGTDGVVQWGTLVEKRYGLWMISVSLSGNWGVIERLVPL